MIAKIKNIHNAVTQLDFEVDYVIDKNETIKQVITLPIDKLQNMDVEDVQNFILKRGQELTRIKNKFDVYTELLGYEIIIGENE